MAVKQQKVRNLILVLGDQLDRESSAFDSFDQEHDAIWMAENVTEATHVWSHKLRLVFFFSAMRHFRSACEAAGDRVIYHELQSDGRTDSGADFATILGARVREVKPEKLIVVEPGDWRVQRMLEDAASAFDVTLEIRQDCSFYCSVGEFADWADGRKTTMLEHFYREMRKRHDVLINDGQPVGEQWNFDHDNRETFGKAGPEDLPAIPSFEEDKVTREVIDMVNARFADHPGPDADSLKLNFPVTRKDAMKYLDDFMENRLANFGTYEDAMWSDEAILYHSRLSALLNVHLLNPRECVDKAVAAYERGDAPLNSVEGFVRQILGWREFIRGLYWHEMPDYIELNLLACDEDRDVPDFFWNGETDMQCVRQCMSQVIELGYAHHIQRLMVLGLYALLLGVHPRKFHDWHMAMYLDAIDWVSLPNTLGMSQFGDGGIVGTKPYCASGNYINKMSNYCRDCRYDYKKSHGENACPFTTLYWDFLDRHRDRFDDNRRMVFQMKNLSRKPDVELEKIREQAKRIKAGP